MDGYEKLELLARFLEVKEEEFQLWSDDSITVDSFAENEKLFSKYGKYEFNVIEEENEGFLELVGRSEGMNIYINYI
jgi:hypothetical protein